MCNTVPGAECMDKPPESNSSIVESAIGTLFSCGGKEKIVLWKLKMALNYLTFCEYLCNF